MPIHVRAEPGDYAEAVLLPGDPLRAKYIAETYLDDVVQTNSERGMLGFRGTWEGNARLGAGDRHGLPVGGDRDRGARDARLQEAAARRHLRRAAAASQARRHDRRAHARCRRTGRRTRTCTSRTARPPTGGSSTTPSTRRRRWASRSTSARSSRATSSTTPTAGSTSAGRTAASSRVEMEAAILFTLGALREGARGLPAHRQRHRRRGRVHADQRRGAARGGRPDDARRARDRDLRLARPSSSSTRRPTTAPPGSAGRSSRTARRSSASRARRCSPSGPGT